MTGPLTYQLVMQWTFPVDLADLVQLEDQIRVAVTGFAKVDGHDCGSGEANIFVYTEQPQETLDAIRSAGLLDEGWRRTYRAAYRVRGRHPFTPLHPRDMSAFSIK